MKADSRTYIRVHDGMDEHPKIEPLSDAAFRLLMRSWFYCSRNLTDGRISDAVWGKRGTAKARGELLGAGLAEQQDGFVQMHDYLDWQRSADEVAEMREKRAEAGRKGGQARANRLASATAKAKQDAKQEPKQTRSKVVADTESEKEELLRSSQTRGRATPTPDRFEITELLRTWAATRAPGVDLDRETERFLDHHRAKGSTFRDWNAAWRTWMSRAGQYQANGRRPAASGDDVPNVYRDIKPWEL